MTADSFAGLPWWQWALVVVALGVGIALVRKAVARARHRAATEKLAQNAEATHESVRTRHQGGP
jgi:hypothetical protein